MALVVFRRFGQKRSEDKYTIKRKTFEIAIDYLRENLDRTVKVSNPQPHKGVFTETNTVKHTLSGTYDRKKNFTIEIEVSYQNSSAEVVKMKNLQS
jgi:hypothetical protein